MEALLNKTTEGGSEKANSWRLMPAGGCCAEDPVNSQSLGVRLLPPLVLLALLALLALFAVCAVLASQSMCNHVGPLVWQERGQDKLYHWCDRFACMVWDPLGGHNRQRKWHPLVRFVSGLSSSHRLPRGYHSSQPDGFGVAGVLACCGAPCTATQQPRNSNPTSGKGSTPRSSGQGV